MSQTATIVLLSKADLDHLKALKLPVEVITSYDGGGKFQCAIIDELYQQLKMYCTSGEAYGGMTLEDFLHTVNDTTTQDGICTTTSTTIST